MEDDYTSPEWQYAGRVHDWRNYISEELQAMWGTFTPAQQKAIRDNAQEMADREHWD